VDKVACCRKLKIEPLQRAIRDLGVAVLLTGVRADEHTNRADRKWREERTEPAHTLAHPLLHWTEMDIWAFAMDQGLPYCELYDQGYRSLGCAPCTAKGDAFGQERAGRDQDKESRMAMLHSLGYF
jgi:phosphoadenosine phosphosulfate reductase